MRRSERLGRDEEMELIRLAQDGDVVARNRIIEAYLPFIAKTCRAYRSGTVDREEYLGTGAIAMMRAIENFDPSHEVRLSTYAMPQVRGDVSRAWAQTNWTVRLGSTPRRKKTLNHLQREKERAGIVAPWPMTSSEIHAMACKLDVSTQDVTDLDAKLSKVDLDEDVFETGEVHLLNPMVGQAPTPHDEACLRDVDARMARSLELAASTLSEKERDIVFSRVFSENPETLETLGLRYEISGERVRQIEEIAIEKLAKAMKAIEPRLVEAMGDELPDDADDGFGRKLRSERIRRRRKGVPTEHSVVFDESGRVVISYGIGTPPALRAEAFVRGHAVGVRKDALDMRGVSMTEDAERAIEMLHHEARIGSEACLEMAEAFLDGLKAGHKERNGPSNMAKSVPLLRRTRRPDVEAGPGKRARTPPIDRPLYHGTSSVRWTSIQADGLLKRAPFGDMHVSLTDDLEVARYWTLMACSSDEGGTPVVLEVDATGLPTEAFSSEVWGKGACDWESETACMADIPLDRLKVHEAISGETGSGENK